MANHVYKDLKRTLHVTAQAQEAQMVNLKGTFSSYDKGSARLVFALEKDSVPFPLASLTANIYLTGEGLKVQYPCDVDKSLSTVTFLLTDEVLYTTGTIRGEVYLNYNQGQRLSAHQFSFKMDKALIDQDLEYIHQMYISDFEDIKADYMDNFSNLQNELENVLGDLELRVSTLQTAVDEMDVLKKAGDTATGLIQFGADTALAVSSNSIKHYIGVQPEGTAIRVYFNQNWGDDFTEYLDIVVGQGEAVSTDERFVLSALTRTSAYVTGFAPPGYRNTKTVINGNEKAARATINYKNVWQITRNRDLVELNGDVSVSGRWTFEQPPTGLESTSQAEQRASDTLASSQTYANNLAPIKEVLWEGDNSGMLTTPQVMNKPISNYDFVHIKFKKLGIAQYDVSDCADEDPIIITRSDLSDNGTQAQQYLRRMKFQFQNGGTEFVGLSAYYAYGVTIQNATDVGMLKIVGIKLNRRAT